MSDLYAQNIVALCDGLAKLVRKSVQPARSCLNCDCFREDLELCQHPQHSGVRPPARIVAYGCALHMCDDDIPF